LLIEYIGSDVLSIQEPLGELCQLCYPTLNSHLEKEITSDSVLVFSLGDLLLVQILTKPDTPDNLHERIIKRQGC
jgi:hypothetical protein